MVAFLHVTTNKMATYAPRTLLRLFNDDKTAHTTGVVLKDGSVYDVKFRSKHASVDEWKSNSVSFTGELTADASKAMGVVITDTHGFEYPSKNDYANWVFEIITELAPHLLTNEAVKNAHQKLISVCKKELSSLHFFGSYFFTGERKYRATLLAKPEQQLYYLPFASYRSYAYETEIVETIRQAYDKLHDLIADDLLPPLREKEEHYRKLSAKRTYVHCIKVYERRIKKYAKIIKESQDYIEDYKKKLEAYM